MTGGGLVTWGSFGKTGHEIPKVKPYDFENALFNQYKIHTVAISHEKIQRVRVTPHVP